MTAYVILESPVEVQEHAPSCTCAMMDVEERDIVESIEPDGVEVLSLGPLEIKHLIKGIDPDCNWHGLDIESDIVPERFRTPAQQAEVDRSANGWTPVKKAVMK